MYNKWLCNLASDAIFPRNLLSNNVKFTLANYTKRPRNNVAINTGDWTRIIFISRWQLHIQANGIENFCYFEQEILEKALGGLRHKLQGSRSNLAEAERYRKQQLLLERELSRVRVLLAHNSKVKRSKTSSMTFSIDRNSRSSNPSYYKGRPFHLSAWSFQEKIIFLLYNRRNKIKNFFS